VVTSSVPPPAQLPQFAGNPYSAHRHQAPAQPSYPTSATAATGSPVSSLKLLVAPCRKESHREASEEIVVLCLIVLESVHLLQVQICVKKRKVLDLRQSHEENVIMLHHLPDNFTLEAQHSMNDMAE
jgi:hypothetical protein